jgi:hypothetical protein
VDGGGLRRFCHFTYLAASCEWDHRYCNRFTSQPFFLSPQAFSIWYRPRFVKDIEVLPVKCVCQGAPCVHAARATAFDPLNGALRKAG